MSSVFMQIARATQGKQISTFGEIFGHVKDKNENVSVALWFAGSQKFLLLKRANKLLSFESLPLSIPLSQAVVRQEETLVCLEGGKA